MRAGDTVVRRRVTEERDLHTEDFNAVVDARCGDAQTVARVVVHDACIQADTGFEIG